jgi:hypothetical protein
VKDYSFGFNGQEKEKQITDGNTHTSAEFWMYDARAGRRWQLDPKPIPNVSWYSCFLGCPILFNDPKGDTTMFYDICTGNLMGQINDKSALNRVLINPNVYKDKSKNGTGSTQKEADSIVADMKATAQKFEDSTADNFDYIAYETASVLVCHLDEKGYGSLEWRVDFDNTAQITIGEWSVRSGTQKLICTPAGSYDCVNLLNRSNDTNKSLVRDNFGFTLNIVPIGVGVDNLGATIYDNKGKPHDYLEIHPDGNKNGHWQKNDGTAGCIGLEENRDKLIGFYNLANRYLNIEHNKYIRLYVDGGKP